MPNGHTDNVLTEITKALVYGIIKTDLMLSGRIGVFTKEALLHTTKWLDRKLKIAETIGDVDNLADLVKRVHETFGSQWRVSDVSLDVIDPWQVEISYKGCTYGEITQGILGAMKEGPKEFPYCIHALRLIAIAKVVLGKKYPGLVLDHKIEELDPPNCKIRIFRT